MRYLFRLSLAAFACASAASEPGRAEPTWTDLSNGENLALRARVTSTEAPYFPSAGSTSFRGLTDGVVVATPAQMFSSSFAVHWRNTGHVFVRLDLPRAEPIERVALRVLGGRGKRHLIYPRSISAWLSSDGASWQRVSRVELERDFPPERGELHVANVILPAYGTSARHLLLHFQLSAEFLFLDEIAVIRRSSTSPAVTALPRATETPIHAGLVAFPDKGEIAISKPSLPNFLTLLQDGASPPPGPITAWFDLPEGVTLRGAENVGRAPGSLERTRYRARISSSVAARTRTSRALFFEAHGPIASGASARITPVGPGARSIEASLRVIAIPSVTAPRTLHVSLGWLTADIAAEFPDVVDSLRMLGFNAFAVFPRYWAGGVPSQAEAARIEASRSKGMDIVYNESPFHVMEQRRGTAAEIRTQRPGGSTGPGVSPCYRGRHYTEELARIDALARKVRARWVFFDSELWAAGARDAATDAHCARLRRSPLDGAATLLSRAAGEIARDLSRTVRRAVPKGDVHVGLYAVEPTRIYQGLFDFTAVSSNGIDLAMPSLYTSGDPQAVRERVLAILAKRPPTFVLPWLTAGTQGEFAPRYLRASVLEAFFSGARGITYFQAEDFDTPEDFLAHAQAIAIVSRYEDFFTRGSLDPRVRITSGDASVTARVLGSRLLVLAGSYRSRATEHVAIAAPCSGPWRDVETNLEHGARSLSVTLRPGESRVFECAHVEAAP